MRVRRSAHGRRLQIEVRTSCRPTNASTPTIVENQVSPPEPYNAFLTDIALREAVEREGGGWAGSALTAFGAAAGGEMMALGAAANRHKPVLEAFDAAGRRIDEVDFHPAYHRLMQLGMAHGVHAFAWRHADTRRRPRRARGTLLHALPGRQRHLLPADDDLRRACRRCATSRRSPTPGCRASRRWSTTRAACPADGKRGCTMGMGMTEKQGGSDVRANTTRATAQADGSYEIVGHKWFFSAPMCDAWLVLAQADAGITCFLLPRWRPDGSRNAIRLQRLKDKLGDWSNASSEVEFEGAWAERVGAEGRGVATILEMVSLTRLDCMTGSAGLMRQAHGAGPASRDASPGLRQAAARAAADEERARRPRHRERGGDGAGAAGRARRRCARARSAGGGAGAHRHGHRQVLDLQAHADARQRGPGMPGRGRLRRGVAAGAPLPPGAAELDLGRLRQHPVPRRAASARPGAAGAGRLLRRTRGGARPRRRSRPAARAPAARPRRRRDARIARAPHRRGHGAGAAGRGAVARRRCQRSRRPSARRASASATAAPSARSRRRPRTSSALLARGGARG